MAGKARLVSGEIFLAAVPAAAMRRTSDADVLDAEFETLPLGGNSSATLSPQMEPITPSVAGMDMLRRSGPAALQTLPGGSLFWAGGLSIVFVSFWFSGGHALVGDRLVRPPSAGPSLRIASVVSGVDQSGAMLTVDGEAINDGASAQTMLPLNIAVTGADGSATRYNLGTSGQEIAPGGRFAFASRVPMPKHGVKSVSVTFGRQN
ncbi:hypothetical protein GA830_02180 [Mesorhizobium sp. NBSH29]|uniref:hypothetical protein n=1 Tax=Mesorhizobium sp. NBSH29 TaxID=2654249 RepID=UPI001896942B|nr:hypothetical protein [Mesorhizobium sp. NBSH29]QPC88477.1 hypothetical protein GA830_02180 [Mesorhizobium sp. NBSH29]